MPATKIKVQLTVLLLVAFFLFPTTAPVQFPVGLQDTGSRALLFNPNFTCYAIPAFTPDGRFKTDFSDSLFKNILILRQVQFHFAGEFSSDFTLFCDCFTLDAGHSAIPIRASPWQHAYSFINNL